MKKHAAPIIAAILLLLPMLYVGSYLALVAPGHAGLVPGPAFPDEPQEFVYPYHAGCVVSSSMLWPLEQLDRKLRPWAWGTFEPA
jgi:hypothetical protein